MDYSTFIPGPASGRTAVARVALLIVLGVTAGCLGACGSMVADLPVVGLPADAPPRKPVDGYLPVHDLPAERDTAKMETSEQAKLRAELAAARDRQAAAAARTK